MPLANSNNGGCKGHVRKLTSLRDLQLEIIQTADPVVTNRAR